MTKFVFGKGSKKELEGVEPRLVDVTYRALELTTQDFTVVDGLRTREEQREYVNRGVSQTMNSKHLKQPDGYGHAVDLVPYINGKIRWEWEAIWPIAHAMAQAAHELNTDLRWGGCWKSLLAIEPTEAALRAAVEEYKARKRAQGKPAFLDGPHYELR